ncbi:maleylpyruvate isomerase family mycothiol-dependent enzyme [Mycolicibacterium grossiae]|uniref:Mycothiol maleylpyruvate isomerase n=1 Tax=Mycolicibacterium grossiae TaxID=1552759 RepID=A0A1E8Q4B1_9MYCO|nr:maleylpyruvate isomerase family mycothiol-dependent enzyme [Mycolicibacterium grossiae]OFJ53335.1 mycothiol maleylpyruvate isomerase [Mycolicibacterium grossiae]QEM43625.1 maleylpyruvate isomerase family mycothiol-dependent enzyme [Mycolicibacterium grossiae]
MDAARTYSAAAHAFCELARRIPPDAWDGPGLGDWDLRSLVGHASRSFVTVSTYLRTTAAREDVTDAVDYYVRMRDYAAGLGAADVAERGRKAGRDLGDDPVTALTELMVRALDDVAAAGDPVIEVIGGLGIRLSGYLPTRTFELAVHGLDVARAAGLTFELPTEVLAEVTALAARIAVGLGDGEAVLLALTGREPLPPGFSAV